MLTPSQNSTIDYVQTNEQKRLNDAREVGIPWKKWGPYLSERQWGTVREDYSHDGNAWDYFSHDQSRSRAYRWGEDGLAGISDDKQQLCFAIALWNGRDPILKERLFGLTNSEGNHGEDVKEYYFYLDSTPTHSYMKYLYKYPQLEFPYRDLVETNRRRSREEFEYELLDTGVFDQDRYFDVFVEYAKADPEDLLIRITVLNRGPETAELHLLPTLWFRDTWSWEKGEAKPGLDQVKDGTILASHEHLGKRTLSCEGNPELLFTENESNAARLWGQPNSSPYVKDAFHEYVISGKREAVNPKKSGTKAAAHYRLEVPAGGSRVVRLRLSAKSPADPFRAFDETFAARIADADEFYKRITPESLSEDERRVHRQALAGMLWSKQYYYFDLDRWLDEHEANPMGTGHRNARNAEWFHMLNSDIISMPDKWEYPWYAAWDLAFHTLALSLVDFDFAKGQLLLMLRNLYSHPNGQVPAYEWNFSDVNPPVHAWATLFLYNIEKELGRADLRFLERSFQGLMLNFNWWVNRKDPQGKNVFAGGFLGLDNIGVFDRSAQLPTGGHLDQADGTAWMAFYCQCMVEIALILTEHDAVYEEIAFRFLEQFLWIAYAMDRIGDHHDEMWDSQDGFFYDVLQFPNGDAVRLKVRSMVGLLPLCASTVLESTGIVIRSPRLTALRETFMKRHPELLKHVAPADESFVGFAGRRLMSTCNKEKMQRILACLLDENEFFGPYGIRSLSRYHLDHPFVFHVSGQEYRVQYLPAESTTGMFGGNSNWRGPVWMPVNGLLLRGLLNLYQFYGDDFKVECPTGSGKYMTLYEVARELARRLSSIFLRDASGKRPVYGGTKKFQEDPHWKDYILFYEYFHGDNGAGLGASHQTGWTGVIARVLDLFARGSAADWLQVSKGDLAARMTRQQVAGQG
jgi:Glycosyl hydrolase family 63 C-terminal domain